MEFFTSPLPDLGPKFTHLMGCTTSSCVLSSSSLEAVRFGVGIIGNMVQLLLFIAPITTFQRVVKKKSTEEFSCVPYVATLFNSVIYSLYASPIVSREWENIPLFSINFIGVLVSLVYISIYFWFSTSNGKKRVAIIMAPVITFCTAMFLSTINMEDRHLRRGMVGSFGCVASIIMYGSPLVAVKHVIQTKSVEFMPFNLSLFSFLTSSVWLAYGLLNLDILLASPTFLGVPLAMLQLVLYCIYREKPEPLYKVDLETGENISLITPLMNEKSGDKK